ncbi:proteasome regulatory particle base subunit rpn10, partial [Coemansia sp. S17]
NGVSIDVVNFGEHAANETKLAAFVEAANNNETSHLVTIPPGPHVLSEQIRASPIVGAGGSAGGGGGFDFGVDADMDPELALALRMSLQDEEERQRRGAAAQPIGEPSSAGQQRAGDDGDAVMEDLDEDEQIRRAIQMSLMESEQDGASGSAGDAMANDDLVASLIGSLPGVDPNDPALQSALGSDSTKNNTDSSKNKDKSDDK